MVKGEKRVSNESARTCSNEQFIISKTYIVNSPRPVVNLHVDPLGVSV